MGEADVLGESGAQTSGEVAMVTGEHESERSAEDDAVGFDFFDDEEEASGDAVGDVSPSLVAGDFSDFGTVGFGDGAGGGDVLPFEQFSLPVEFDVTWFEVDVFRVGFAVCDNTGADACG